MELNRDRRGEESELATQETEEEPNLTAITVCKCDRKDHTISNLAY